jgi:uncharacterized protein (TIGR03000 family)
MLRRHLLKCVAAVAAALLMAAGPQTGFAQHRGGGHYGGGGFHGGGYHGGGYYGGGYRGGGYYHGGYSRGGGVYHGGYYRGYRGYPGYYGYGLGLGLGYALGSGLGYPYYGYGYSSPYYGYSYPDYAYGSTYVYPSDQVVVPDSSITTQSLYTPAASNQASVTVVLPTPDAQVFVQGTDMTGQGAVRQFVSPPLEPGQDYAYTVRARWQEGGRTVDQTRTVDVRANQAATVDFTRPAQ